MDTGIILYYVIYRISERSMSTASHHYYTEFMQNYLKFLNYFVT